MVAIVGQSIHPKSFHDAISTLNNEKDLTHFLSNFPYNPSTNLKNDDYCDDLKNGNDETITSACSHLHTQFRCQTIQYGDSIAKIIPSSRVNDGK